MTSDEVRTLDNRKCLVLIRGFHPICDDKFHTLEMPEYKEAVRLGPYRTPRRKEIDHEAELQYLYLGGYPHDGQLAVEYAKSFRAQVERYGWVAEESAFYKNVAVDCGEYIKFPMTMGYYTQDGAGIKQAPLFTAKSRKIKSADKILTVHDVIGYWTEYDAHDGPTLFDQPSDCFKFFNELTRGINGKITWDNADPDLPENRPA